MIIERTIFKCDICEEAKWFVNYPLYRISGGLTCHIKAIQEQGWIIQRDDKYKLTSVLCPKCQDG
jgi:hypothetical protein